MRLPWPFHDRRKEIVEAPFPEEWMTILEHMVHHYALLTGEEQERLRGDLRIFQSEKNWEGALGFEITDEVKVTISATASLLTLGFSHHEYYPNVQTIIVYPTSYIARAETVYGQAIESSVEARLGEAHGNGPIILSWEDIFTDGLNRGHGHSLILHEFSHKLDFRDGDANGTPLLRDKAEIDEWAKVMSAEYDQLLDDVQHKRHTPLRAYGATNPAEFFAVCTECFFDKSVTLRNQKPELYRVLLDYYGIDWAMRIETDRKA